MCSPSPRRSHFLELPIVPTWSKLPRSVSELELGSSLLTSVLHHWFAVNTFFPFWFNHWWHWFDGVEFCADHCTQVACSCFRHQERVLLHLRLSAFGHRTMACASSTAPMGDTSHHPCYTIAASWRKKNIFAKKPQCPRGNLQHISWPLLALPSKRCIARGSNTKQALFIWARGWQAQKVITAPTHAPLWLHPPMHMWKTCCIVGMKSVSLMRCSVSRCSGTIRHLGCACGPNRLMPR